VASRDDRRPERFASPRSAGFAAALAAALVLLRATLPLEILEVLFAAAGSLEVGAMIICPAERTEPPDPDEPGRSELTLPPGSTKPKSLEYAKPREDDRLAALAGEELRSPGRPRSTGVEETRDLAD